jgi:4-hydroxybenzoate polyprenyltransferase
MAHPILTPRRIRTAVRIASVVFSLLGFVLFIVGAALALSFNPSFERAYILAVVCFALGVSLGLVASER